MTEQNLTQYQQDRDDYAEYLKSLGATFGFLEVFYLLQLMFVIFLVIFTSMTFIQFVLSCLVITSVYGMLHQMKSPKLKYKMSFDEFVANKNKFPELDQ